MPKAQITVANALRPDSTFVALVENGLGALLPADRQLIAAEIRSRIGDSFDLDAATRAAAPNDHRWDYILSVPSARKLIGYEPHSASDSEIKVVIRKRRNALTVLRSHLRDGQVISEWHWVTRGSVGFSKMDRAYRALAEAGITFGGRQLRL